MKVSELMKFDKVYETLLEETPQPATVYEVGQNHIFILMDDDDEVLLRYEPKHLGFDINHIEPISLTKRILSANGFKASNSFRWVYRDDEHDVKITVWLLSKTVMIETYRDNLVVHPQYVHELQHALRICGLNDIADNFKIE